MADVKAEIRTPTVHANVYRATLPGGTSGPEVQIGDGLKLEDNVLSVDTADKVEQDNTKPVTSAAVFSELADAFVPLSNIEIDEILNKFK